MTTTATVGYLTVHREVNNFERPPDPTRRQATGYQQQSGPRSPEYTDHRREGRPFVPDPGPAAEWFEDNRSPDEDPLWMAGQVLTLADDKAAQVAQEAQANATSIRDAAHAEATALRDAAAREAAEVRARLDTLTGELGRVVAAYVSEALANPAMPATAPAQPRAEPTLPGAVSAPPATSAPPAASAPAKTPAKPQKPGRQQRAMRVVRYGTAAALMLALAGGATEIGVHGWKFFIFRESGQGQTEDGGGALTDTQYLAKQAAAAHNAVAPKGRHHKPIQQTTTGTTKG